MWIIGFGYLNLNVVFTKHVANYCVLITTQQLLIASRDKFQFAAYEETSIRVLGNWHMSLKRQHVLRNSVLFLTLGGIAELQQTSCNIMEMTVNKRRKQVSLIYRPRAIGLCNVSLSLALFETQNCNKVANKNINTRALQVSQQNKETFNTITGQLQPPLLSIHCFKVNL